MFCVKNRLPVLLSRGTVKLVIVDSIAALFRSDFQVHETFKRSKLLSSLSAQLRKLSDTFNIPVVCVNQVSDSKIVSFCNNFLHEFIAIKMTNL